MKAKNTTPDSAKVTTRRKEVEPRQPRPNGRSLPTQRPSRVIIDQVYPQVDGARFPVKRVQGEALDVEAVLLCDGHDELRGTLRFRHEKENEWHSLPMKALGNDRWQASFTVSELGFYYFQVEASIDRFRTWARDVRKKLEAGQNVDNEMRMGLSLFEGWMDQVEADQKRVLQDRIKELQQLGSQPDLEKFKVLVDDPHLAVIDRQIKDRASYVESEKTYPVRVDPPVAGFSAWYEFFPRSCSEIEGQHGTFKSCTKQLEYVASMGFDVVYLPPIHPIGAKFRKGKNNSLEATEEDVGSPWAIGGQEGGHRSIHPDLGTIDDFVEFRKKAETLGLQVALDLAYQCSPDHPYVKEHPEWFKKRPDGSIQYAENPPKKYQDIYPFDFETTEWVSLWEELLDVILYWVDQGVKIFRVDNPHTKSFPFWEWAIAEVRSEHPEVIFLSEAFTRPHVMAYLAKIGFSQSYTYFTWRNTKQELQEYLRDLTKTNLVEYFRPNFWPNTPDILPEMLQRGGRAAFMQRFILASTLSANYGVYGPAFELGEFLPMVEGKEEYLHSEKYQLRQWDLDRPDSLAPLMRRMNRIRNQNPALQNNRSLIFHPVTNDQLLAYSKVDESGNNIILTVVNLDPYNRQAGVVDFQIHRLGIDPNEPYEVHDLVGGTRYFWQGYQNYVELDPYSMPAHVFSVKRRTRSERDFEQF